MKANAKARHIRMSARKARLVTDLLKGRTTQSALAILGSTKKRAAEVVNKLLRSALANAKNKGVKEDGLFISKICADEGSTWKRSRANAFGRSSRINKRTCHITVELDQKVVKVKPVEAVEKKKIVKKSRTKTSVEKK